MRSYGSTFACALALISTISAAALPLDTVSDLVSDLTSNALVLGSAPPTLVTDIVSSDPVSNVGNAASEVVSELKASKEESVVAGKISSVTSSVSAAASGAASAADAAVLKISKGFPSDIFPGFFPGTILTCKYGDSVASGLVDIIGIPSKEAGSAPVCSTSSFLTGTYMLIMIDPDAVNPQHIHYLQTDLSCSNSTSNNSSSSGKNTLSTAVAPILEYAGPSLPLGTGFHRYTTFLMHQPEDFSMSDSHDFDRENFDIVNFASKHKLGQPAGATFFVAENLTGDLKGSLLSGNLTNALLGNLTHGLLGNLTYGLLGNLTNGLFGDLTKLLNGTLLDPFLGNRTNTTLLGSSLFGNGTHGNSTLGNGHNSTSNGTLSTNEGKDGKDGKSSTGPVPISPTAKAHSESVSSEDDINGLSTGGSSVVIANFALAGFVGMVTVGVAYL
ncbi:PEBP-like protein [Morchella conica CCBAS932]|uniref:PEBP-like protein n=1 Tax=Morchella conica CCBAS932 TaxID=1392247 RepID=A0A3N4KX81_9PEZI|nr:PEBP-like protein [Morchella conica CCBAS932]